MWQLEVFIFMFSFVMIANTWLHHLSHFRASYVHFATSLAAERDLIWCGQHQANLRNLKDAKTWALRTFPQYQEKINRGYLQAMQENARELKGVPLDAPECTHSKLPSVKTVLYQEKNPSLPRDWPNWRFRLSARN